MRKPHLKSFAAGLIVGGLALTPVAAGALSSPSHAEVQVVTWPNGSHTFDLTEGAAYGWANGIVCNDASTKTGHATQLSGPSKGVIYSWRLFYAADCKA